MDEKDTNPADEWPLPPPWMWSCAECVNLYKTMKHAPEAVEAVREALGPGLDHDFMDSVVTTQIRLAQHLALRHAPALPAFDEKCERCVSYATDPRIPAVLGMEHRARHVFVPECIVGLM
ncbi:hypothetical protein [Streptomyces celluloflavus]|uniref:hypothetical protein n=1 Tax=Streptomyces celluloflavus TaxID=58344 RepID=UPI00368CD2F3